MRPVEPSESADSAARSRDDALVLWVVRRAAAPMIVLGKDDRIREVNDAFAQLMESSPSRLVGRPLADLLEAHRVEDLSLPAPLRLRTATGRLVLVEHELSPADSPRILALHPPRSPSGNRPVGLTSLVAGLGHAINNPLSYVIANTELLREEVRELRVAPRAADPDRLAELEAMLDDVEHGAHEIRSVVQDLRALADLDAAERTEVGIDQVVAEALELAREALSARAPVHVDVRSCPVVRGNGRQLAQAIASLLTNAARSLDATTQEREISVLAREEGGGARVEVADRGGGVAESALDRVFDPFQASGTARASIGLALSIARELVASHGGTISARSVVGRGSTFVVWLPAAEGAPGEPRDDG